MSRSTGDPATLLAGTRGIGNAPMGFEGLLFFGGMLWPRQKFFEMFLLRLSLNE